MTPRLDASPLSQHCNYSYGQALLVLPLYRQPGVYCLLDYLWWHVLERHSHSANKQNVRHAGA